MRKIVQFLIVLSLLLTACVPIFAADASSTIVPGIDTATVFEVLSAVLAAIIGHFTINSKWASVIKWLLVVFKWAVSILEALNKTNAGETMSDTANQASNTIAEAVKISDVDPNKPPVGAV